METIIVEFNQDEVDALNQIFHTALLNPVQGGINIYDAVAKVRNRLIEASKKNQVGKE